MTYLDTDRQTQTDLSVTESLYDEQTLCSLYKKTVTKNGRICMMEWLSSPLSDVDAIRKRQEAIAWENLPELPLTEEELDFVEYYLAYRDQLRTAHPLLSLATKIDRLLKYDSYRYIICRGVALVLRMLYRLEELRNNLSGDAPLLLKEFGESIREATCETELGKVLNRMSGKELPEGKYRLSFFLVDKYDYLFRNTRLLTLRKLLDGIYQLDALCTAHRVAQSKNFCCRPCLSRDSGFSVAGFAHPFVKNATKNDWQMAQGNICIFTGSNMAGKSTTLRALGTIVWLAHCGLPVPVSSMTCPVFDGIYTSINLPDSLRDGRSHFLAEILRIKEVLRQAVKGRRCLVILDEMFRGTNAQDAYEASVAVNELLKQYRNCCFLVSTHILEYAKHFEGDSTCCFYYMESAIEDDCFICSYRLRRGISESRVGYWMVKKELTELAYQPFGGERKE